MKRVLSSNDAPLRIMHCIGSLRVGGAENVVSTILKGSDTKKNQFYLLSLAGGPLIDHIDQSAVTILIRPFSWPKIPIWLWHVAGEIRDLRIDVLHTHLFTTDVLGRIAGFLAGVPVVVSTFHAPSTWKRSRALKNRTKRKIDAWSANHLADGITAISETTRLFQIQTGGICPHKIRTITNPVLTALFQPDRAIRAKMRQELNVGPDETLITKVGSLYEIKGHQYLLRAIKRLSEHRPYLKLLIIGEGPTRTSLQQQAVSLGIENKVLFTGLRHDIPDLLRATDIFVMSSLSEGISVAILEAMASGLPIVATRVGGNIDLLKEGETGLLVESKSDDALADALGYCIDHPQEARYMGEAAREYAKAHHDAQLIARQYENFYRELLKDRRSPESIMRV